MMRRDLEMVRMVESAFGTSLSEGNNSNSSVKRIPAHDRREAARWDFFRQREEACHEMEAAATTAGA